MLNNLHKFFALPVWDKLLLLETLCMLLAARALIIAVPIKWYAAALLGRHMQETSRVRCDGKNRSTLGRVRWAANALSCRMPWEKKCLALAIALKLMLRRRGFATTSYFGVRKNSARGLEAHSWLRCGDVFVAGGNGSYYTVVSMFAD